MKRLIKSSAYALVALAVTSGLALKVSWSFFHLHSIAPDPVLTIAGLLAVGLPAAMAVFAVEWNKA
jgi:hypothetical protein